MIFLFVGAYLFRDQLILNFAMIFPEAIGIKLLSYSSNPEFFEGGLNIIGITFKFIFPSFIIIYALCKKGNDIFYLKANIWENCSILYAFFLFSTLFVPIMERFSNYFFVVSAILFASCIYKVRMTPHSNAIATFVISILVLSYQINYMVSVDPNAKVPTYVKYYPYTSVFNKIETDERALFNSYWSGY